MSDEEDEAKDPTAIQLDAMGPGEELVDQDAPASSARKAPPPLPPAPTGSSLRPATPSQMPPKSGRSTLLYGAIIVAMLAAGGVAGLLFANAVRKPNAATSSTAATPASAPAPQASTAAASATSAP